MDLARLKPQTLTPTTTAATGTNWTALPSSKVIAVVLTNDNDTSIEFRRQGGASNVIPPRSHREIRGVSDAAEIEIRRKDVSNTQVTVHVEAFSLV